ncbi:gamma-glutamylcyclotransferase [Salinicola corii]|uniref:Gamma-glutamylcyclotransferase n=1 Tax=Salinicola corii TaxID=2606937 RepID=A0A640WG99_9GAMM|nr:gamma-glutamylcyclotransferase family protein [Salinicola corii]KAA0019250.1 gamma-glutamylcyclotransferase [Salinicola corii]
MIRRFLKWLSILLIVAATLAAGGFWYTFMSPYGYHPAEPAIIDERIAEQDVFVYGTLRHDWLRWIIMGTPVETREATLEGYRKQDLDILPQPDGEVRGEVLTVNPAALRALDRYERLGVRYTRESVKLEDGTMAWVYKRLPE